MISSDLLECYVFIVICKKKVLLLDVIWLITLFFLSVLRTDERPSGQVTKFVSGDDMDDDFTTEVKSEDKNKSAKSEDGNVKPKKGPKVVNFV